MTLKRRSELKAKTRLQRHTPLKQGGGLKQGGSLKQTARLPRQSAKKRSTRRTWAQLRVAVLDRSDGTCDLCATAIRPEDFECHHRRLRSQGGLDEMANCVALHDLCHSRLHGDRVMARETGFIVHKPDDPTVTPVLRHGRTWALPGETWAPVDPEELAA
jgi:5-methylcytosine-specific restriction endonuclease McrA